MRRVWCHGEGNSIVRPVREASVPVIIGLVGLIFLAMALLLGWVVMLLVGVTHHEFGWPKTTIAYGPSVGLGLLGTIVASVLRGNR